jgi:CelD/BcsL family acetyltransferase involved in cellulose biosynthesis
MSNMHTQAAAVPVGAVPLETPAPLARWQLLRDPAQLTVFAPAWDGLVAREGLPAVATSAWMHAFCEAFVDATDAVEVHLVWQGDQLAAALPVRREGRLVRRLRVLENEHNPYWAAPLPPAAVPSLLPHLFEQAEIVEFRRLALDGPLAQAIERYAAEAAVPLSRHEQAQGGDSVVPLVRPWELFERSVSKNLRRDGQDKRLAALGTLTFQVVTGGDDLTRVLPECLELEARGWKGVEGAPINADPRTARFYGQLARGAGRAGNLALYLLRLDGRLIAFEFCLRGGSRIECLKISYDETLARLSPGTVLRMHLLRHEIETGSMASYHLGRPSAWKQRWATEVKPLGTLRLFAPTLRGRATHLARTHLPAIAKQLPGLTRLVPRRS